MTLAATSTFNVSAQDLIDTSLRDVGAIGPADTNPDLRPHALTVLNMLVKSMDAKGVLTWKAPRRTVTLTSGVANYTLDSDAYDIDQPARYTQSGSTTGSQVLPMVRDEYMSLPDRTITGVSCRYFVDRSLTGAGLIQLVMYLFPVPANTGDTIELALQIKSADLTDLSQTLDVTQKWLDAIHWNLTHALCPTYNVPVDRMSYFRAVAKEKLDEALGDDNERGDIQLVPFGQQLGYGYGRPGWR